MKMMTTIQAGSFLASEFFTAAIGEVRHARACIRTARGYTGDARHDLLGQAADSLEFAGILRRTAKRLQRMARRNAETVSP